MKESNEIRRWITLKTSQRVLSVKTPVTHTSEFNKHVGPRVMYGKVTISAEPSKEFSFTSSVKWSHDNFDDYVLCGLMDVLVASDLLAMFGGSFRLIEIGWDEVNSCAYGYYMAARQVAMQISTESCQLTSLKRKKSRGQESPEAKRGRA